MRREREKESIYVIWINFFCVYLYYYILFKISCLYILLLCVVGRNFCILLNNIGVYYVFVYIVN